MQEIREADQIRKGYWLGIVSFVIAAIFAVAIVFTFFLPNYSGISLVGLIVGIGSVIAAIYLAIALLS